MAAKKQNLKRVITVLLIYELYILSSTMTFVFYARERISAISDGLQV